MTYYYPNYDTDPLEIYQQECFEVYDPWSAKIRGVFYTSEDAELFRKTLMKKWKKEKNK